MMNDKDKMHPEDTRNLIIFVAVSLLLWFAYETYVMKPQAVAMKKAQVAKAELMLKDPELLEPSKPLERVEAIKTSERISFDSGEIHGTIALTGGRIDDLRFRQYFKELNKKEQVELLSPSRTQQPRYIDYGWVSGDAALKMPDAQSVWQIAGGNRDLKPAQDVTLFWENGQGLRFERTLSIDKHYVFTVTQRVQNLTDKPVSLNPYALVSQTAIPKDYQGSWMIHEGPMGFIGENLVLRRYDLMKDEPATEVEADTGWIGISDKYWLTALMPAQGEKTTYRFRYIADKLKPERDRYQMDFTGQPVIVAPQETKEVTTHLYTGAKKVLMLEDYAKKLGIKNLDLAVDFGWFWFFTYPFFLALHYLGLWTGNMGAAIIILTVIIRGSVFPLTNASYRSFAKMKKFQPQILEIRETYKGNKEQMQRAMVELYQREGVNPLAGCLPIFIQIPIFFAFYKILLISIELRHAPFFGWIQDLSSYDPTSLFNLFGLLPYEVPHVLMIGVWPCLLFIAFMVQKQLNPPPQDQIQRDIANWMPYVTVFIMGKFASGLVIYWTFSALVGVMQQMIIMRSLDVPIYLFNKDHYRKEMEQKVAEGPALHPLVEMAEDEAGKALFGEEQSGDVSPVPDMKPPKPRKKKKKK